MAIIGRDLFNLTLNHIGCGYAAGTLCEAEGQGFKVTGKK
jgi:hypothetical protein